MSVVSEKKNDTIEILGARTIFRNFMGKGDDYNREGARNFGVVLSKEQAEELSAIGWNVKQRPPREENEDPLYYLKMNLQFQTRGTPPRVVMVGSKSKTPLSEATIDTLDHMVVKTVDVRFRAYEYSPGKFSAYVVTLFAVIEEDDIEMRYADIPTAGAAPVETPSWDDESNVRFQ